MPQAVRIQDICTGHECYPPRPVVECSPNVFIEKRGAVNTTHLWAPHSCDGETHPSVGAGGSSSVNINGSGAMAVGQLLACTSMCMTGANTVFIGG